MDPKRIIVSAALSIIFVVLGVSTVSAAGQSEPAPAAATETSTESSQPAEQAQTAAVGSSGWQNPMIKAEFDDRILVYDAFGDEVTISKNPERAIVNYTSMLGIWYLAGGTAIGRPDTRSGTGVPPEAMDIQTTGHVASPNTEVVISLQPDLVILSSSMDNHKNLREVLQANDIESLMLSYEHYEDFENLMDLFARINNDPDVLNRVVPQIREQVASVRERFEGREPVKFLSLFASARDVSAETDAAHTARMAGLLGGENIVEQSLFGEGQSRVTLSMERILERDPDIILVTTMGSLDSIQEKMREDLESNEAWAGLRAVREGNVVYLPNEYFLYKPNDSWPDAFEYLGEVLYSE